MKKLALAAAVALATTACIISTDDDSTFTIVNDSDYVLVAVYIAEVSDPSWGPNLLPDVLFPGEELVIIDIDCGTYDVLVTDDTGVDCELRNIDLCFDDDAWVITNFTLDVCAFGG